MDGPYEIEFNKPTPFNPNKNSTRVDWQLWKKHFLIYLDLTKARLKFSGRELALLLLNLIGPVGIEAKENMIFDDPRDEENMEILLTKFDEVFSPPYKEMEERYQFFSRRKYNEESIHNYVKCLKELADKCNFGEQTEKFILDMVVLSMDYNLRQRIFLIKNLSLSTAIKSYELQNLIEEEKMRNICGANFDKSLNTDDSTNEEKKEQNASRSNFNPPCCSKCGTNHPYQPCPAYDYTNYNFATKGQHENKCKNVPANLLNKEEEIKNTTEFESKSTIKQNDQKDLQHCLWCGSRHSHDQCQHNFNCTRCDKFPHDICFNCKKNPHENSCYYKTIITLPAKPLDFSRSAQNFQPEMKACGAPSKTGNFSKNYPDAQKKTQNYPDAQKKNQNYPDAQKSRNSGVDHQNRFAVMNVCLKCETQHGANGCPLKRACFRCNTQHPPRQCPAFNVTCSYCGKLGHFERACMSKKDQEYLIICPSCKKTYLEYYNEDMGYCKHCNQFFSVIPSSEESEDSDNGRNTRETASRQPRRRNRRRRGNNRKENESCSIS